MTLQHPMFPPAAETVPHRNRFATSSPKPATIGRRGLLGAFLALVPVAATAGTGASLPAAAAPVPRESGRLIWLGQQLDQVEAAFAAALKRKARCRDAAELAYPEPPAEITWLPGQHPPAWCGVCEEADSEPDKRSQSVRDAKSMLPIARAYEAAIEAATADYNTACNEAYELGRRIDRIAILIYKCECRTFEGVAIKALALMVATQVDAVDNYIAHRSKLLYAEQLAAGVLKLRAAAPMAGGRAA
ncbi:hypothetical protein IVB45_17825 [Bradyrhizobium sp. 4]|uniref:hypothetical protein n=1 Tax=unclassified Bradyrhizobium TaxID=2631580 RepID=UPI001FF81530|nr:MULTISPECIES: hypothetical protein [unclassified Bradyrhizobium]MCK1401964.1 hypothetical protein [Bradyrhizobium sp. 39]MCK1751316.1 hypothetical protein [Bradyrhizobium sp. 135]UPJ38564.1 hypothetical protein IVB45_17825 [Bradyrhizobium sp. 4]